MSDALSVDARRRQVTGYASTFNHVDHGMDVVLPGAFRRTIREDFPAGRIKATRNHGYIKATRSHGFLVGRPVHLEEDDTGLLAVLQLAPTPFAEETLTLVEDGVITDLSIGYTAAEKRWETVAGVRVRALERIALHEIALLDERPMDPRAAILGAGAKHTPLTYDLKAAGTAVREIAWAVRRAEDAAFYARWQRLLDDLRRVVV